jgi:hypothetical protein
MGTPYAAGVDSPVGFDKTDALIAAALCLILVAGSALTIWWFFWPHGGTAAHVARWLKSADCAEVNTKTIPLPITGPAHAEPAFRRFADQAIDFKEIECGFTSAIDFYRFSSTTARVRAVASYPDLHRLVFCSRGAEVLVDELGGYRDPFVEYCQRLGFQLHRPSKRSA